MFCFCLVLFPLSIFAQQQSQYQRPQTSQQQGRQQQQQQQQQQQGVYVNTSLNAAQIQDLCEVNADFKENCREVTQLDKCSRQFSELCCTCEDEWSEEFEYCKFQLALFPRIDPEPLPSPSAPPVVIEPDPEPVPFVPDVDPDAIDCVVQVSNVGGSCSGGYSTAVIDASGSSSGRKGDFLYRYKYNCSDGYEAYSPQFLDASGKPIEEAETTGVAYLQVREPLKPAELSCFLEVQVELQNSKRPAVRRCQSGVLFNDCSLGCESDYLLDSQFVLDGYALEQKRLVQQAGRLLKRSGGPKKRVRKLRKQSQALYAQNWTVVWSLPDIAKTCTSAEECVAVSNVETLSTYQAGATQLFALTRKTAKRARKLFKKKKLKRRAGVLIRKARLLNAQAQVELSIVPEQVSSCTGGNA